MRWSSILVALIVAVPGTRPAGAARTLKVAVVFDGPGRGRPALLEEIRAQADALLRREAQVRLVTREAFVGDHTREGIDAALDRAFGAPGIDVVLALGAVSSHLAARRESLPRPVMAPFVLDAEVQGIPSVRGTSGRRNLTWLQIPYGVERSVADFHDLFAFERLALLFPAAYLKSVPAFREVIEARLADAPFSVTVVPVAGSADAVLAAVPETADAVWMAGLSQLPDGEVQALIRGLNGRGLPTFARGGRPYVERGALLSMTPDTELERLARRIANVLQRLLAGESLAGLPTRIVYGSPRLILNVRTARRLGFDAPWAALVDADFVGVEEVAEAEQWGLPAVVGQALQANPEVVVARRRLEADAYDVSRAWTRFLPAVAAGVRGRLVDADRAARSFGSLPERLLSGVATLDQLVWSEDAAAAVGIEKRLQAARADTLRTLELDTVEAAATTYLALLQARTSAQVERRNLARSRAYLEMARIREETGAGRAAEVDWWRARVAEDKGRVLRLVSRVEQTRQSLNRLLGRPPEAPLEAAEPELDAPYLLGTQRQLEGWLDSPRDFEVLGDLLTKLALEAAPELAAVRETLAAQEREVDRARRSFFLPTVSALGEVEWYFAPGGAGTEARALPPELDGALPERDAWQWTVGFAVTLPVFDRGLRVVALRQARAGLAAVQAEQSAQALLVAERIRTRVQQLQASWPDLALSREAAAAARRNLQAVETAYTVGAIDIGDLTDAQALAFQTELAAANATYRFLQDLVQVERATGRFRVFGSAAERDRFFRRLEALQRTADEAAIGPDAVEAR